MKKLQLAALSAALLLALNGCTSSESEELDSQRTLEHGQNVTQINGNANSSADEATHLVMFNNSGAGGGAGSEAGSDEDSLKMVQDFILDETGVYLESIMVPGSEWDNRLSAMFASEQKLDIWWGNWSDYAEHGIIHSLNDVIDEYGQDVHAIWEEWDAWARVTDKEGVIWGVPRYNQFVSYFTFVRTDYLEKLGMDMPKTFEELESYLYAVKEADPAGNGQTIPLIHRGGNVGSSLEWAFLGGFTENGRSKWIDNEGNIMPKELQPGYRDFIEKMRQWYADGIIHPENFSWNTATVREYISSGRVGASAAYYVDVSQFTKVMQENVPEADFAHYEEGMTGPNGDMVQTLNAGNSKQMLFSAKLSEHDLGEAMKLVNWAFSDWYNYQTLNSGIEGRHWDYDDSVVSLEQAKKEYVVKNFENSGYYADFSIAIGLPYESKGVVYDESGKRNKHNIYLSTYLDDTEITKPTIDGTITYNDDEIEKNIPTLSDFNTTIAEGMVQFVTGERDMSEYESFIASLNDVGLQDWVNEYTRQYNELTGN